MALLTAENYARGLLMDDDLMAGITEPAEQPGSYVAYVLRHTTAEYLGYQAYPTLGEALEAINRIPRQWTFARVGGGCAGGNCAAAGGCKGGGCGKKNAAPEVCGPCETPA